MPNLTFYRQKRVDGGVRTGVELDGETVASLFEEGDPERDPALLWFVDLRCEGPDCRTRTTRPCGGCSKTR